MKSLKKKNKKKKNPSCLGKGRMLWFLVQHSVSILLHPFSNSINVFNICRTKKGYPGDHSARQGKEAGLLNSPAPCRLT